jgi:hypothetical protein
VASSQASSKGSRLRMSLMFQVATRMQHLYASLEGTLERASSASAESESTDTVRATSRTSGRAVAGSPVRYAIDPGPDTVGVPFEAPLGIPQPIAGAASKRRTGKPACGLFRRICSLTLFELPSSRCWRCQVVHFRSNSMRSKCSTRKSMKQRTLAGRCWRL